MLIIPLRIIRYSDTRSILNAYSRENGRLSFLIPEGNGKAVARRRSLFQPLFPIEGVVDAKPNSEFARISATRPVFPMASIPGNPVKQSMMMFLAELLSALLRHPEPDPLLFDFIISSIRTFDSLPTVRTANFHIVFLYRLAELLGIFPDIRTYSHAMVFDMKDSVFRITPPLHKDFISPEESAVLPLLDRLSYRNMHLLRLSREQRNAIIDRILRYYEIHDFPIHPLRTLPVLRSLF